MSKTGKTEAKTEQPTVSKAVSQDAKQTNWLLLGGLKNIDKQFLRVGALLTRMRDKKLYAALRDEHKNYYTSIESYAAAELRLGRSSLYKYLNVYAWVGRFHPEWLVPKPKGFIPDLSDCSNLIWVESELARKNLEPERRKILEDLRKKGLNGSLRQGEVDKIRHQGRSPNSSIKALLSKLLSARAQAKRLAGTPDEVIRLLDSAIGILKNDSTLKLAGMDDISLQGAGIINFISIVKS